MKLGEKLLKLRKGQELTLDELASRSGIAKATISRLENDITTGTLRTHMKLCEAFGISLTDLYSDIEQADKSTVLLESKTDEAEVFTYDEKTKSIILAKQISKKNMLPQLITIEPGGKTAQEENKPGTEKFIYCLEGEVEAAIKEETYRLKKASSLYFKSSIAHSLKNIGKKTAKVICVSSPVAL